MSEGKVLQIFICSLKGEPMHEVTEVLAMKGYGLEGDRYATGQGAYPTGRNHVTLIAAEVITAANEKLLEPFSPGETRRSIVTQGVDLNSLVDKVFMVGQAWFLGVKLCAPCTRPAMVAGRGSHEGQFFKDAFENQGGLNAEVFGSGVIRTGDRILI